MSGNPELLQAGKVPLRVIGTKDFPYSWEWLPKTSEEAKGRARLAVALQEVRGLASREQTRDTLAMLGLA